MREQDSFLQLIGLDEVSDKSESESFPQEGWENFEAESFEDAESFENTEREFVEEETTEGDSDWDEQNLEYEQNLETIQSEVYEEAELSSSQEVLDEPTRPTSTQNFRTSIYSHDEIEFVTARIKEEMSLEDRLLDGLEEAEESRATDIFAKSFRSDVHKTRLSESELESAEEWPDSEEVIDMDGKHSSEEDRSDEELGVEGDPRSTSPSRQTLAFNYNQSKSGKLHVIEGPVAGQEFLLELLPLSIGRDPKNNLVLDDSNVSRFHAEIRDVEGQIIVVDLGSTNGIKVNGALVTEHRLQDHDILQIGDSIFEFLLPDSMPKGLEPVRETYIQNTGSPVRIQRPAKNKKIRKLAAAIFVLGGILFAYQNRALFIQKAEEKGKDLILSQIGKALEDFKTELEIQYDRPVNELSEEELRENFIQKLEAYQLLPDFVKAKLRQLPTALLRVFLEDPLVLKAFMDSEGDQDALKAAIRSKLSEKMKAQEFESALSLVELLLMADPQNAELLSMKEDIESRFKLVISPSEDEVSEEDRQKFFSYMQNFQEQTQKLIDIGELEAARSFAQVVKEKTLELIREQPAFGTFAESAVAEWSAKIEFLDRQIAKNHERKYEVDKMLAEGDQKIEEIKRDMDAGRVYEASLQIDEFFKNYPDHPRVNEVKRYALEIDQAVSISFQSMNSKIETYIKTENFKVAWETLYRFLDLMPGYEPALSLRENLLEYTRMRAVQYYNQARVFEFEADDLIAAEQYYKKVLETVDPRGELAKKAERRYADVRRKTIQ